MALKENLAALMAARGLKLSQLARLADVPKASVYRMLNGSSPDPGVRIVAKIAEFFEITILELIDEKPPAAGMKSPTPPQIKTRTTVIQQAFLSKAAELVKSGKLDDVRCIELLASWKELF